MIILSLASVPVRYWLFTWGMSVLEVQKSGIQSHLVILIMIAHKQYHRDLVQVRSTSKTYACAHVAYDAFLSSCIVDDAQTLSYVMQPSEVSLERSGCYSIQESFVSSITHFTYTVPFKLSASITDSLCKLSSLPLLVC